MALADILRRIDGDADSESAEVLRSAEADAGRMLKEAQQRAVAYRDELLARTETEAAEEGRTRVAAARLRGRDSMLREKRTLIERALARATEELRRLSDADYTALLVSEAARHARGGERVLLSRGDQARLRPHVEAALARSGIEWSLAEETVDEDDGLLLERGKTCVRVSASKIVASRREDLESRVAGMLFQEEAG